MRWHKVITHPLEFFFVKVRGWSASDTTEWLYQFLNTRWPALSPRIPEGVQFADAIRLKMLVTHTEPPLWQWIYTRGGTKFLTAEIPDPYFACGCHSRGNAEWLLVMFREGGRRFWFYEQFVVIIGGESHVDRVAAHLDAALSRWDAGGKIVMYSDRWGWFDSEVGAFERDISDPEAATVLEQHEVSLRCIHAETWQSNNDV